jgi:hypothetical protein
VTSGDAVRRRPSLGKQFKHTFFGGDAKTAVQYMLLNVLLPSAQEMFLETLQAGMERLVYGESRPRRGPMGGPMGGALGHVAYNRMSQARSMGPPGAASPPPAISRRARSTHAFDEIIIPTRNEAEEVLDRMHDILSKYESVTVADLYELTGVSSAHTDHKWGWTDLRGARVGRVRGQGGYLLDLPAPEPLGA